MMYQKRDKIMKNKGKKLNFCKKNKVGVFQPYTAVYTRYT